MELTALRSAKNKVRLELANLSLKSRLVISFVFLLALTLAISLLVVFQNHHFFVSRFSELCIEILCALMLVLEVAFFRMHFYLSQSISRLAVYLDQLDPEGGLNQFSPKFSSQVPELELVATSFERLVERLQGYKALNFKRLLIEKQRADMVAALISDGICLLRKDEVIYLNPVAEKILGVSYRGTENTGLCLNESIKIESEGIVAVRKAISQTLPVEYTLTVEERKFYYLIRAYPITEDVIEQLGYSAKGSFMRQLDEFQADMLILAQDVTLVKESQEAKSHFLATLSHEVKTPVTSLTMATRLLKRVVDQIPNPAHQSLILTCTDDVDRLRSLLEDLLNVSRFDTLAQRLEIQRVDLGKLVRHAAQSFHSHASEREVELSEKILSHGKSMMVPMDATKIAWALSNLITNALRHTPPGGKVQVSVELHVDRVQVSVSDTGPGIERHRQGKIFDKFSSYYDLRIARSGSVGAGLAIAREIVVAHGGRIWVESEPGHGANFCFTLPLKQTVFSLKGAQSGAYSRSG